MRRLQVGDPVEGCFVGTPIRGQVSGVRPHSCRPGQVVYTIRLDAPTVVAFLGRAERQVIALTVGEEGCCPHQPERTYVRHAPQLSHVR